jgi:2-polyprenyl-3-methyl-5-hydroxy-6-metoxy-1,4-benzoquinol methylase
VLSLQVYQPAEEQKIRGTISRLTPVDEGISANVRQLYEENPYPRWVNPSPVPPRKSIEEQILNWFPTANIQSIADLDQEILIAGCGTGQHPVETAQAYPNANILAIDLSLSSLSYATRKARQYELKNLQFAQADILKLGAIDRQFSLIESMGVLHHLQKPREGLAVLLSLLRPRGIMMLGLYSETARQSIVAARAYIAAQGLSPTLSGIRECRKALMTSDDSILRKASQMFDDFASASGCRDLLFHVQEHRLTIPEIQAWLAEFDLTFLGFLIKPELSRRFQQRFPQKRALQDLNLWHNFELENPDSFVGMYQFAVQKRDPF